MKKTNLKINILAIFLIVLLGILITPKVFQNDTYYTITIGEHIVENGIDMKDPFSWHKDLKYTYPHWAYDLITYLIYSAFGFQGIYFTTIFLTIILGLTMYFCNANLNKNRFLSLIFTILALYFLRDFIAARAQLFTFILFILEVYLIEKYLETSKKRYGVGLIIIPIILANMHLAVFPFYFILYLPYIGEWLVYYILRLNLITNTYKIQKLYNKAENTDDTQKLNLIKKKIDVIEGQNSKEENFLSKPSYKIEITKNKNTKGLIIIMLICLFTGLLTPLGTTPYTYLIKTMQGNTTECISEHLPLTLVNNVNFMVILMVFLILIAFIKTKIRLSDLFMLGGLILLTFYSRRQESMVIIICMFIAVRLICNVIKKEILNKLDQGCTDIVMIIIWICIVGIIGVPFIKNTINQEYVDENNYPVKASEYILNNLDIDNIKLYNEYNYGSYLLFKGIPVFIDSRADLYAPEFNENTNVFSDSINLNNINCNIIEIEDKFSEYGITHLILYKNNSKSKLAKYVEYNPERYNLIYPTGELEDNNFYIFERLY